MHIITASSHHHFCTSFCLCCANTVNADRSGFFRHFSPFCPQVTVLLKPLPLSSSPVRPLRLVLSSKPPVTWLVETEQLPSNVSVLVQVSQSKRFLFQFSFQFSSHSTYILICFYMFSSLLGRCLKTLACSHTLCVCMFKPFIHYLSAPSPCTAGLWSTMATCPLWHTVLTAIASTSDWERVRKPWNNIVQRDRIRNTSVKCSIFMCGVKIHFSSLFSAKKNASLIVRWADETDLDLKTLFGLHFKDPTLAAVCRFQSMFLSHNYMTSDLQPQEVQGCTYAAVGGDSPEVHVIKLHSAGSGLCGWEHAASEKSAN